MPCCIKITTAAAWTQGWGDLEGASDGSFLEWVGRSQLYSGDVLAPQALEDLTGWMAQAAPGDRRSMMALLRELHATISPTGYALWAHAHGPHPCITPPPCVPHQLHRVRPVGPCSSSPADPLCC